MTDDIDLAFISPGDRSDRVTIPLETTDINYTTHPDSLRGYDLLLADTPDRTMLKYMLRAKLRGIPVLFRMRGDPFWGIGEWIDSRVKKAILFQMLQRVDGCIAIAPHQAETYRRETGVETHVVALPNEYWNWNVTPHTDTELRAVTLTNAVYPNKIQPLIDIAPTVNSVLSNTGGTWKIGSWSEGYHERLEEIAATHEHIEFELRMDAHDALEWANLMIHYSDFDSQANAILEGMASKLPVITNDHTPFANIGYPLRVMRSTNELQTTLKQFQRPGKRERVGADSLQYVKDKHAPEIIGEMFVQVFERYV